MKKITTILCTLLTLSAFAHESDAPCSHMVTEQSTSHFLDKLSLEGTLLATEDGSQWQFSEADASVCSAWNLQDELAIMPNASYFSYFSIYTYTIKNLTQGTSVLANLYYGPEIGGKFTRQVETMNASEAEVTLSDHSSWLVSTQYESQLSKWEVADYIIVGTSNNPGKNILINVNLNKYIEVANCN